MITSDFPIKIDSLVPFFQLKQVAVQLGQNSSLGKNQWKEGYFHAPQFSS